VGGGGGGEKPSRSNWKAARRSKRELRGDAYLLRKKRNGKSGGLVHFSSRRAPGDRNGGPEDRGGARTKKKKRARRNFVNRSPSPPKRETLERGGDAPGEPGWERKPFEDELCVQGQGEEEISRDRGEKRKGSSP